MDILISCIIKIKPMSFLYVFSCSVVSDSCHSIDCSPARLLCAWDSPRKSTGVGCHFLLQGGLPNLGIEPRSPALQTDSTDHTMREALDLAGTCFPKNI